MQAANPFVEIVQEFIGVLMRRSTSNFFLHAKSSGLSMSQIGMLFQIRSKKMCGVSEIGDEMGITSAAASQMIDRMVQQGLVSRSEDPHDRRLKRIVLTEKGQQMLNIGIRARQRWLEELGELLTPEEQEQVGAVLRLLIEKAEQLEQPLEKV